jgi:inositol 1,4,5-triphosphate receptor type 1/inositol 1,4,5-triphosphate receptor type 3
MRSLLHSKNLLNQVLNENLQSTFSANETQIKVEICDLINFLMDLRQDFLISNFIAYFDDVGQRLELEKEDALKVSEKLEAELKENITTVLPPPLRTGVESVDEENKERVNENSFDLMKNVMKLKNLLNNEERKIKKFKNYTNEEEMPDLDALMLGARTGPATGMEILPALLMSYHNTNDSELEKKLLQVILRCFNQRKELVDNINKLEIFFEHNNVRLFFITKRLANELRLQAERSEVSDMLSLINKFIIKFYCRNRSGSRTS